MRVRWGCSIKVDVESIKTFQMQKAASPESFLVDAFLGIACDVLVAHSTFVLFGTGQTAGMLGGCLRLFSNLHAQ